MDRPDWRLLYWVAGGVAAFGFLALLTSPVATLLGDSDYAIPSSLHGVSSIVYVIIGTVLAYMGYLLYTGRLEAYHDLKILSGLAVAFSLLTVMFGNWTYIAYRAADGPRAYFMENEPAVHQFFFEFKEFIALFTFPLAVAAAVVIRSEGPELRDHSLKRQAVAVLLFLAWAFLMLAFGLGAAITKLRSV